MQNSDSSSMHKSEQPEICLDKTIMVRAVLLRAVLLRAVLLRAVLQACVRWVVMVPVLRVLVLPPCTRNKDGQGR